MTAALLSSSRMRTGLFISPHVIHYGERFAIDGEMLSRERFSVRLEEFLQLFGRKIDLFQLTEFEILTAFAVWLFNEEKIEAAVMETGLGGRFDAVSALDAEIGILTGIARDHIDILGGVERDIAREKLFPFAGKRVIFSPGVSPEVKQLAEEMSVRVIEPQVRDSSICVDAQGTRVKFNEKEFKLPLCGEEYAANALTALTGAETFLGTSPEARILETIHIPARFQQIEVLGRTLVVDGAHNEQAINAVVKTFQQIFQGVNPAVLCGFMKDKDYPAMIAALKRLEPVKMVAVKIPSAGSRGLEPEKTGLETAPDLKTAFQKAIDASPFVLVAGSLYLAGDFLAFLNQTFKIEVEKLNYYIS